MDKIVDQDNKKYKNHFALACPVLFKCSNNLVFDGKDSEQTLHLKPVSFYLFANFFYLFSFAFPFFLSSSSPYSDYDYSSNFFACFPCFFGFYSTTYIFSVFFALFMKAFMKASWSSESSDSPLFFFSILFYYFFSFFFVASVLAACFDSY